MSPEPFRLGVNYWPAHQAMAWLADYDPGGTRQDFQRCTAAGLTTIRVFVRWADIQPDPNRIDPAAVSRVVDAADAAAEVGAQLIVTLFTGHMSGLNWVPAWALSPVPTGSDPRFRTSSPGAVLRGGTLRNWYADPGVTLAQERVAATLGAALAGHPGVWGWDLGNENSNCTRPPDAESGASWLCRMAAALRTADPGRPVTIGLHLEDLEEDRGIGPAEAAEVCDVVSMHGYPIYAPWASGPTDPRMVPFLAALTRWLAGGAPVLFEEFGLPTRPRSGLVSPMAVADADAAAYAGAVLDGLWAEGCLGALWWCYTDYDAERFAEPPFDEAIHERSFGLWRADGSPKPAVEAVRSRAGRTVRDPPEDRAWIDISPAEFFADRHRLLAHLYRRYSRA
ncbi:MAG TPA: cellulase family glycosylhydrolase [Actinomycetota bacterium]|nr:cellulase family glycosylhydrolase [Actinomycetota bacterium]